jgi:N-glycosylase/DNA lyase
MSAITSLDHPLAEICASLPNDPVMERPEIIAAGCGSSATPLNVHLHHLFDEQVAHIRQIVRALRERYGRRHHRARELFSFPTAERLAQTSERATCAPAPLVIAQRICSRPRLVAGGEVDLETLARLPDKELRDQLCALPGVGSKVANCVMLFAYERLRAFPIDVWIERVLREKYFPRRRRRVTAKELGEFAAKHFGAHGGYAQQYLFHYARKTTPRRLSPRRR